MWGLDLNWFKLNYRGPHLISANPQRSSSQTSLRQDVRIVTATLIVICRASCEQFNSAWSMILFLSNPIQLDLFTQRHATFSTKQYVGVKQASLPIIGVAFQSCVSRPSFLLEQAHSLLQNSRLIYSITTNDELRSSWLVFKCPGLRN